MHSNRHGRGGIGTGVAIAVLTYIVISLIGYVPPIWSVIHGAP